VRIFTIQLGVAILVLALGAWWPLRLRLIPGPIKRARAREAAQHEFVGRGMADTRGRTGVLLFVSAAEHHAEVIGDLTISARVDEGEWRVVIERLVEAFARGARTEGLVVAVREIGGHPGAPRPDRGRATGTSYRTGSCCSDLDAPCCAAQFGGLGRSRCSRRSTLGQSCADQGAHSRGHAATRIPR
jgi:hypothetical protein